MIKAFLNGELIGEYNSIREAEIDVRNKIDNSKKGHGIEFECGEKIAIDNDPVIFHNSCWIKAK